MRFIPFLAFAIEGAINLVHATEHATKGGQPIIIDTDLFSDVDDVGALTIANVLHNCGLADLRGIVINTPSQYGALAASVSEYIRSHENQCQRGISLTILCLQSLSTYFGNDVPIAAFRPITNDTFFDGYFYLLVFPWMVRLVI